AGEGGAGKERLAGAAVDERIGGVDAVVLDFGTRAVDVDDDLAGAGGELDLELVGARGRRTAAGEIEDQAVTYLDGEAGQRRGVRRRNLLHFDRGQPVGHVRRAIGRSADRRAVRPRA